MKKRKYQRILIDILRILVCILRIKKKKHFKKYQYDLDYLFNEHNKKDYISNNAFKDAKKLLNERKSNLLRKETNKIRKILNKKEADYNSLKEKEQKNSLTNREEKKAREY